MSAKILNFMLDLFIRQNILHLSIKLDISTFSPEFSVKFFFKLKYKKCQIKVKKILVWEQKMLILCKKECYFQVKYEILV